MRKKCPFYQQNSYLTFSENKPPNKCKIAMKGAVTKQQFRFEFNCRCQVKGPLHLNEQNILLTNSCEKRIRFSFLQVLSADKRVLTLILCLISYFNNVHSLCMAFVIALFCTLHQILTTYSSDNYTNTCKKYGNITKRKNSSYVQEMW